jgi:hypothetical protein
LYVNELVRWSQSFFFAFSLKISSYTCLSLMYLLFLPVQALVTFIGTQYNPLFVVLLVLFCQISSELLFRHSWKSQKLFREKFLQLLGLLFIVLKCKFLKLLYDFIVTRGKTSSLEFLTISFFIDTLPKSRLFSVTKVFIDDSSKMQ